MSGFNDDIVFAQEGMRIGDTTISTSEQASIQFDEASGDVALLIANTSDDAASSSYQEIKLNSVNSGETFTRYRADDTCSYALGFLADDSTPTFRLTFNNNGDSSPNNRTMTPWRISSINPGADTMEMVVKSFLTVASEGAGTALFQVNSNQEVGTNAVILLNQFNGTDDTYIHHGGGNGSNWRYGTYASDNSNFYITNAAVGGWPPNAASTNGVITQAGEWTFPLTPAFCALLSMNQANVTGDGTAYTVNFQNERFDQNGDYDGTNTFTAPVDGKYNLAANVNIDNSTSSVTVSQIIIHTSNQDYTAGAINGANARAGGSNNFAMGGAVLADMDDGDESYIQVQCYGLGSNTLDLIKTGNNFFSGYLQC